MSSTNVPLVLPASTTTYVFPSVRSFAWPPTSTPGGTLRGSTSGCSSRHSTTTRASSTPTPSRCSAGPQDATYELDLVNDRQRRFHVELIFPDLESDLAADGDRWGEYKLENREMFERIDQALLEEHIEIAENWPS